MLRRSYLLATSTRNRGLAILTIVLPRKRLEDPIGEAETVALKSDLGHPAHIAEAVTIFFGFVLGEFDLDCDTVSGYMGDLRGKQTVVGSRGRAQDLAYLALSPVVAADKANRRKIPCLDPFKLPFREIHDNKSMRAIGEIKDGLPFGDR